MTDTFREALHTLIDSAFTDEANRDGIDLGEELGDKRALMDKMLALTVYVGRLLGRGHPIHERVSAICESLKRWQAENPELADTTLPNFWYEDMCGVSRDVLDKIERLGS